MIAAVYAEKELAEKAAVLVGSEEGTNELDRRMALISVEAKQLFSLMEECKRESLRAYQDFRDGNVTEEKWQALSEEIEEKLSLLDGQFDEIMEQVHTLKTAYSLKNPWISLYKKARLQGEVTKKDVRKLVDRIVVENLHYIGVELVKQDWKAFLPADWTEGGMADGKKKQA